MCNCRNYSLSKTSFPCHSYYRASRSKCSTEALPITTTLCRDLRISLRRRPMTARSAYTILCNTLVVPILQLPGMIDTFLMLTISHWLNHNNQANYQVFLLQWSSRPSPLQRLQEASRGAETSVCLFKGSLC